MLFSCSIFIPTFRIANVNFVFFTLFSRTASIDPQKQQHLSLPGTKKGKVRREKYVNLRPYRTVPAIKALSPSRGGRRSTPTAAPAAVFEDRVAHGAVVA
uniref:Putative secreted protein n=1 Tax=Anopheles marajoara TaxID=58244 RepID=A0A2M4C8S4_9DIPT